MQISIDAARKLAETFLTTGGMSASDSAIIADILLEAELRGRKTHGFIRLPGIKSRYEQEQRTEIKKDKEVGQCIHIDGGNELGYLVAYHAMEIATDKTKQTGTCICGVFNTSHCGMAGYYVDMVGGKILSDCSLQIACPGLLLMVELKQF